MLNVAYFGGIECITNVAVIIMHGMITKIGTNSSWRMPNRYSTTNTNAVDIMPQKA